MWYVTTCLVFGIEMVTATKEERSEKKAPFSLSIETLSNSQTSLAP